MIKLLVKIMTTANHGNDAGDNDRHDIYRDGDGGGSHRSECKSEIHMLLVIWVVLMVLLKTSSSA